VLVVAIHTKHLCRLPGATACWDARFTTVWLCDLIGLQVLHETGQRFRSGLERTRDAPLSEKRLPHEDVWEAARRGILEELAGFVTGPDAIQFPGQPEVQVRESDSISKSYPGLKSRYTVFEVHARVDGLPSSPFSSQEGHGDDSCEHFWSWKSPAGPPR
jgi:hypothetical protein